MLTNSTDLLCAILHCDQFDVSRFLNEYKTYCVPLDLTLDDIIKENDCSELGLDLSNLIYNMYSLVLDVAMTKFELADEIRDKIEHNFETFPSDCFFGIMYNGETHYPNDPYDLHNLFCRFSREVGK